MLSDGVNSYAYNYDNRMISAGTTDYSYNTRGIRTEKTVNGETTKYIVDMNESYPRVVEELDSLNNLSVRYEAGEKIISQTKDGQISFFLYDGFGSTRILTDLNGTSTDLYEYDAYGNITTQSVTAGTSYLYRNEQYDTETQTYYLRARQYSPVTGRFTQMDSWAGNQRNPITLNKYIYGNANPVMYVDPSGHCSFAIELNAVMSIENVLATISIAVIGSEIIKKAKKIEIPFRVNHYTRWEVLPYIMAGVLRKGSGINSPSGKNYVTEDWYFNGDQAKSRLALPERPNVLINLFVFKKGDALIGPNTVSSAYGELGLGTEYYTFLQIPVWERAPIVIPLIF